MTPAVNPFFVGIHFLVYLRSYVVNVGDRRLAHDIA